MGRFVGLIGSSVSVCSWVHGYQHGCAMGINVWLCCGYQRGCAVVHGYRHGSICLIFVKLCYGLIFDLVPLFCFDFDFDFDFDFFFLWLVVAS